MMIGRLAAFLCLILLAGCVQQPPLSVHKEKGFLNSSEAGDYMEEQFIRNNPRLAQRYGEILTLYLSNGQTKTFEDKTFERCSRETPVVVKDGVQYWPIGSCIVYYRVIAFWPDKAWFLIEESYHEGGNTLVINGAGESTVIGGLPTVSPKHQRMFTYDPGCGMDDAYIEIWDVRGSSPKNLYASGLSGRKYGGGEIHAIRWLGENNLVMTVRGCEDGAALSTLFLEQKTDEWIWSGKDPYPDEVKKQ